MTVRKFLGATIRLRSNQQHNPQFLWISRVLILDARPAHCVRLHNSRNPFGTAGVSITKEVRCILLERVSIDLAPQPRLPIAALRR